MKLGLVAFAGLLVACTPLPTPDPVVPPEPSQDGGTAGAAPVDPPPPVDACVAAGDRLEQLQCRDETGAPLWQSESGESFTAACRVLVAAGVPWDVACIARLDKCENYNAAATGELCRDGGAP